MKKRQILLFAAFCFLITSCTKDYPVPVFTPETNTWVVNTDTIGPATFRYNDTTNTIFGSIAGKASVTVRFAFKPKVDGKYVFREVADELDEVSVLVVDSVNKISWISTDDDGRPLKEQQYADITVNGRNIGIAFNEKFLKRTNNMDRAKVSLNISY